MKKGQIQINKWHFKLGIIPLYQANNLFMIHFGIFKLFKYPQEGMIITKDCFKGFWFRKQFHIRGFEISI